MQKKQFLIFLLCFMVFGISQTMAFERSEAFIIRVFHQKVKVLSPVKSKKKQAVIVENKTLVKLIGRVQDELGNSLGFVSIEPGKFQSIEFVMKKNARYFFVPLSPAFQEIELLIGQKSYEIPPKK